MKPLEVRNVRIPSGMLIQRYDISVIGVLSSSSLQSFGHVPMQKGRVLNDNSETTADRAARGQLLQNILNPNLACFFAILGGGF